MSDQLVEAADTAEAGQRVPPVLALSEVDGVHCTCNTNK
jgi:hypothetical protein